MYLVARVQSGLLDGGLMASRAVGNDFNIRIGLSIRVLGGQAVALNDRNLAVSDSDPKGESVP